MFILSLALIPGLAILVFLGLHFNAKRYNRKTDDDKDYNGIFMVWVYAMVFATLVPAVVSVTQTMKSYSAHLSDIEDLAKFVDIENVYTKRAESLTAEFTVLVNQYLGHEKATFDNMSPEDISVLLVRFPELKASKTILELVAQIRSMQDDVYAQQVERAEISKNIRFRTRNPWILHSFLPKE